LPLWVALVIALAAFAVRSASRGFDFTPDMPTDAIVLFALLAVVALVGWLRADDARRDAGADEPASQTEDPES
jgi:hypothetical protein